MGMNLLITMPLIPIFLSALAVALALRAIQRKPAAVRAEARARKDE